MISLKGMTSQQVEAIRHREGPAIVIAIPGAGKTRVITYRIADLLDDGVTPGEILAVTFTNKAAEEMKGRVGELVGGTGRRVWISTFHSMCCRMLRREPAAFGVSPNFGIADRDASIQMITQAVATVTGKKIEDIANDDGPEGPSHMMQEISACKQEAILPPEVLERGDGALKETKFLHDVYQRYQRLLKRNRMVDFDDMLMKVVLRFRTDHGLRKGYASRFRYLLVDEYQDTNGIQYEIVQQLASVHGNPFVVGDDDQCLVAGTRILTREGWTPIERVRTSRLLPTPIVCAAGHGKEIIGRAERVFERDYNGPVIRVRTARGREIVATPEHCVFARFSSDSRFHYVYLMYREDRGFRMGRVGPCRTDGRREYPGFTQRARQERADAVWLLRACKTLEEAVYWEVYLSTKYGMPTTIFYAQGRDMTWTDEMIEKLFSSIDTRSIASRICEDFGLSLDHPHHKPHAGKSRENAPSRRSVTFGMFVESRLRRSRDPWHGHSISIVGSDEAFRQMVDPILSTKAHKENYWRARRTLFDYDELHNHVNELVAAVPDLVARKQAKMTENMFSFMPIGNLIEGALVPTVDPDVEGVEEDEVIEVSREHYKGKVYDLSVPIFRNYVAEGVVVHNSIYGWRGADAKNLLKFQNNFADTKLYVLDRNFRSVGTITSAANSVITNNSRFVEKTIIPVKPDGPRPRWVTCIDEGQQAGFIAGEISTEAVRDRSSLERTAILYRTNAQSRKLVEVLTSRGIPHRVLGSLTFYQRSIIKDMVSYLQLINNPRDDVSFTRLYNRPARGIGAVGFAQFCAAREDKEEELDEDISLVKMLANRWHEGRVRSTAAEGFRQLRAVIGRLRKIGKDNAGPLMTAVLETTRVREKTRDALKKTRSEKQREKYQDQLELLSELEAAVSEFDDSHGGGLAAYLEFVALMQAEDKDDDGEPKVTLMSCHRAKGTEFRNVYLVGCVEGLFPILGRRDKTKPNADPGQESAKELARLEEERRVFFVGMTRAEERLTFLTPLSRRFGGDVRDTQPSRFVMEAMSSGRVDEVAIEDTMLGFYRGSHGKRRRRRQSSF